MDYSGYWFKRSQKFDFCRLPLLFVFVFTQPASIFCQDRETVTPACFVELGVLVNNQSVIDQKFSSLSFTGYNPGLFAGFKIRRPRADHIFEILYTGGRLETANPVSNSLKSNLLNVNYYNLLPVYRSPNELFSFLLGTGMEFLYQRREYEDFINSGSSFETVISLAGTAELQYIFGSDPNSFRIKDHFTLPFLFYYVQPSYTGLNETLTETESGKNYSRLVFIPEVYRLNNMITLEKPLGGSISISIFYNWDFYQINSSRQVNSNNHSIGLIARYKI